LTHLDRTTITAVRDMVGSVFTPLSESQCSKICDAQYMPLATAAYENRFLDIMEPLFEQFKLTGICCSALSPDHEYVKQNSTRDPSLLIWSPGFRESLLDWSAMAQYVASIRSHHHRLPRRRRYHRISGRRDRTRLLQWVRRQCN